MPDIDVYVSFSRHDQNRVSPIVDRLGAAGLHVFWDRELRAGERYDNVIEAAVEGAKCVLVFWSHSSVRSDWVRDEASMGLAFSKLFPVRLDPVELPLGFSQLHTVDLSNWNGDGSAERIFRLVQDIRTFIAARPEPTQDKPPPAAPTTEFEPGRKVVVESNRSYRRPMAAGSTSIFVAHTTGDKPRIAPIVAVLVRSGFSVWIDKPHLLKLESRLARKVRGIEFGTGDWKEQIRRGVRRARVVLALWSDDAIDARREQFYYEVYMGLVQGKLCQARLDAALAPSKIGMPFTFDQIADLSDFEPNVYHPELDFMIEGFAKFRRRLF